MAVFQEEEACEYFVEICTLYRGTFHELIYMPYLQPLEV